MPHQVHERLSVADGLYNLLFGFLACHLLIVPW
jgi:hypothetical protein